MEYYSARLLVLCLIDDGKPINDCTCDYPFIIFKAKNEEAAFNKAIEIGKKQETIYKNEQGNDVRWVLAEVEEIWSLGKDIDGIEVGSIMDQWETDTPITYTHKFNPSEKFPIFSSNEIE